MPSDLSTLSISLNSFASGVTEPVGVTHAGDGSDRLFVVEKGGMIRVIDNGVLLDTPFLNISDRISTASEQGLLGLAFSPSYGRNGEFYINYTDRSGDTVIARYQVSDDPNRADSRSEQEILTVDQDSRNHNGGQLAFGPDEYLYIGLGDGGGAGDPRNRAQDPSRLLGKLLRIDVESSRTYRIPSDNPFLAATDPNDEIRDEIWAFGLRNPWRFSFDRVTGDLYIADVGQAEREEINFQPADSEGGENYGWRVFEGTFLFNDTDPRPSNVTFPATEYDHSLGRSVTGGYVYRGTTPSDLTGVYLYGDFVSGRIWGLRQRGDTVETAELLDTSLLISSFGEDESGNLYVADYDEGVIYAITPPPSSLMLIEPDPTTPAAPEPPNDSSDANTGDGNPGNGTMADGDTSVGNGGDERPGDGTATDSDRPTTTPPSIVSDDTTSMETETDEINIATDGNDRLQGSDADDIIRGLAGDDRILGGKGADILYGNQGNDRLLGEAGNDRLLGGAGNDRLVGGNGADQLVGGSGSDRLLGGNGADQLLGGNGADRLVGGKGNDGLDGGAGADVLLGQRGNDRLVGHRGRDRLSGGAGRDIFVLDVGKGADQIQDFQAGGDRFELPDTLTFAALTFQQQDSATRILAQDRLLATVLNIQVEQISPEWFA